MLPYIFVLAILLLLVFVNKFLNEKLQKVSKVLFFVILVIFIGFRYDVGGDWNNYLSILNWIKKDTTLLEALKMLEPGYMFLNFIAQKFNLGIAFVNFFCALILVGGLYSFLKKFPYFWLSMLIFSYTIFVVGMGYTRQSAAIGFLFFALSNWDKSKIKYVIFIILGGLFHHTIFFMLIFLLAAIESKKIKLVISVIGLIFLAYLLKTDTGYLVSKVSAYILSNRLYSSGALLRIFISVIPSAIIIYFYKSLKEKVDFDLKLWLYVAYMNLVLFVLAFYFSTLADRLALYLIPIQVVGYTLLIRYLIKNEKLKKFIYFSLAVGYFALMISWFLFASHRGKWIPYDIGFFI